jgi:hypothetical protein
MTIWTLSTKIVIIFAIQLQMMQGYLLEIKFDVASIVIPHLPHLSSRWVLALRKTEGNIDSS